MSIHIRKATEDDAGRLREFDKGMFPEADWFSEKDWRRFEAFWIEVDGTVVGSAGYWQDVGLWTDDDPPASPGTLFLVTLGILPEHRRRGYAGMTVRWFVEEGKRLGSKTILSSHRYQNAGIIRIMRKHGFTTRYVMPDFYQGPPDDALVMALPLR